MEQKHTDAPASSRTENSARNASIAAISQALAILMGFFLRVVFTHTLSEDYVGISGLFRDILNILSLTELGMGTAITYSLYPAIAAGDIEKQKSLMRLYQWFYRGVAALTLALGLLLVPFMDWIIKDPPKVDHLMLYYVLHLSNTVFSYLLVYKKTLLDAHQLSYIPTLCFTASWMVKDVLQALVLILFRNFTLFLVLDNLSTIAANLVVSWIADRKYPYLREKKIQPLDTEETRQIRANVRALMIHRFGDVAINNTDNLILSSFVGIASVGTYSNHYLIIGSVTGVLRQFFGGIMASVGDLGVSAGPKRLKKIFEALFFIGAWVYGISAVLLYQLLNPFVAFAFGRQYVFSEAVVALLSLNFYFNGMRMPTLIFRDSLGLFWYDRYKAPVAALVNIAASILLALRFGAAGVFAGTLLTCFSTHLWVEPLVLYKYRLDGGLRHYFARFSIYTLVTVAAAYLSRMALTWIFSCFFAPPICALVIRFFTASLLTGLLFLLVYSRFWEFPFLWGKAMALLAGKKK